ncbi:MAG: STAS domain-containing protein [Magnetococcales bacterium]|nr:STAS domain-containing protein [Magnetococcales bacterium]
MAITSTKEGTTITLQVSGILNWDQRGGFMQAITGAGPGFNYIVDLSETENIESAGLGMLLMMREMCGGGKADITLKNANAQVREVMKMAQFSQLFRLV